MTIKILETHTKYKKIGLFFSKLGQAFSHSVKPVPDIENIHVESCDLTSENSTFLLQWIQHSSSLKSLILQTNSLSDNLMNQILQTSYSYFLDLEAISLKDNFLSTQVSSSLSFLFKEKQFPNLKTLNLSNNLFSGEDISIFSEYIFTHSNLTYLNLSENAIEDEGAKSLAYHLENSTGTLRILNLELCAIQMKGAIAILKALSKNTVKN